MSKRKVRIDKDYCSSTVWSEGANWEEVDFGFTPEQLILAKEYDNLWEEAHQDINKVDLNILRIAEQTKFKLLANLAINRKDIIWTYWDTHRGQEVVYDN